MTAKSEARSLTLRQKKGRAVNAAAELLRKRLSVPNIYIEPPSSLIAADVLAVDRAGSGDLHGVAIHLQDSWRTTALSTDDARAPWVLHLQKQKMKEIRSQLMSLPAHYRYLAIPQEAWDSFGSELGPLLYSADGIGRIGIISIIERGEEPPVAELSIAPERFRVDPAKLRSIETKLLSKVRPDIEVRI